MASKKKKKSDVPLIMTGVVAALCFFSCVYRFVKDNSANEGYDKFLSIILIILSLAIVILAFTNFRKYTFACVTAFCVFVGIKHINNFNSIVDEFREGKSVTEGRDINLFKVKAFYVFDALHSISLIILAIAMLIMLALIFFTKLRGLGTFIIIVSGISALLGIITVAINVLNNFKENKGNKEFFAQNISEVIYILLSIAMVILITVSAKESVVKKKKRPAAAEDERPVIRNVKRIEPKKKK